MFKSDCEQISNLIPLYVDSMLSEEENDIVCEHIKNCPKCREDHELLKSVMTTATAIPEISVPEDFHKNLMNKIEKEAAAKKRVNLMRLRRTVAGFAAAAAVVALSVVTHISLPQNSGTQNIDELVLPAVPTAESVKPEESKIPTPVAEETASATPETKRNVRNFYAQPEAKDTTDVSENVPQTASEEAIPVETNEPTAPVEEDTPSVFSLRENEGISVARIGDYHIITVTLDEGEYEKAEEILSDCEKDDLGYKLPEDSSEILFELSELSGYTSTVEVSESVDCDYLILNK